MTTRKTRKKMVRRVEEREEPKEQEFDELQAMRRIDNLLKRAPDEPTRMRVIRWLFSKWSEDPPTAQPGGQP